MLDQKCKVLMMTIGSLFVLSGRAVAQCDAILRQGVFEVETTQSDERTAQAFSNFLRITDSFKRNDDESSDMSAGASYAGFGAEYGQSASKSMSIDQFKDIITSQNQSQKRSVAFSRFAQRASRDIVAAWLSCMQRHGLHVSVQHTYDPHDFFIRFDFEPVSITDEALNIEIKPSNDRIKCDTWKIPKIDIGGKSIHCTRLDNRAVSIAVDADRKIDGPRQFNFVAIELKKTEIIDQLFPYCPEVAWDRLKAHGVCAWPDGNTGSYTWAEANQYCNSYGARLCELSELTTIQRAGMYWCIGTWTATPIGDKFWRAYPLTKAIQQAHATGCGTEDVVKAPVDPSEKWGAACCGTPLVHVKRF